MVSDGLRCLKTLKLQQNGQFHRNVWQGLYCDAFSNVLEFLLPILEYLSHLLSDFSNGLQHCDGDFTSLHVICESIFSVKYF